MNDRKPGGARSALQTASRPSAPSIGYAPRSPHLRAPGDRRRFAFYAHHRKVPFELTVSPSSVHDVVVVTESADIPAWIRAPSSTKIVYDLVDSYLALPRLAVKNVGRGVAKRLAGATSRITLDWHATVRAMCRRADAVVCATDEQRNQIAQLNPNVHVILDDHSELGARRKHSYAGAVPFRLVWEGLPYTLPAFASVAGVINEACRRDDAELHLVTDLEFHRYAGTFGRERTDRVAGRMLDRFRLHPWSVDALAEMTRTADLGLIPADLRDPFSAGKPENRLLIFWRLGLPVLTSATPAYMRTMERAGVDMTCTDTADWRAKLKRYMGDEGLRRDAAERGLTYVRETHSPERLLAAWDRVFASIGV
jgi:glycosyltransferase involved in cell wall biosynthesis